MRKRWLGFLLTWIHQRAGAQLREWADATGQTFVDAFGYIRENKEEILGFFGDLGEAGAILGKEMVPAVRGLADGSVKLMELYSGLPDSIKGDVGIGLVGGILFGPKGGAVIAGAYHTVKSPPE